MYWPSRKCQKISGSGRRSLTVANTPTARSDPMANGKVVKKRVAPISRRFTAGATAGVVAIGNYQLSMGEGGKYQWKRLSLLTDCHGCSCVWLVLRYIYALTMAVRGPS